MISQILLATIIVLFLGDISWASTLSTIAASLSPGQWSTNLASSITNFDNGDALRGYDYDGYLHGSALEYADKACVWNPVNKTVMCIGGGHGGRADNQYLDACSDISWTRYNDSTNSFDARSSYSRQTLPPVCVDSTPTVSDYVSGITTNWYVHEHSYHHQAMDDSGNWYHRTMAGAGNRGGRQITKLTAAGVFSSCTSLATDMQNNGALEYFPDRNSLLYLDGDFGVWELSLVGGCNANSWIERASGNAPGDQTQPKLTHMGSAAGGNYYGYNQQSRYSKLCHCIIFGGGSQDPTWSYIYRYNADGTFKAPDGTVRPLAAMPSGIGWTIPCCSGPSAGTIVTVDPVSGKLLVWQAENAASYVYEYDPSTDTWATIALNSSGFFPSYEGGVNEASAIPIPDYGVIMFISAGSSSGGKIYLYKHASDFVARCAAPGVLRCFGFDSDTDLGGTYGNNYGRINTSGYPQSPPNLPAIDTSTYASGGGSLHFVMTQGGNSGVAGQWFANFSSDLSTRFGSGGEFWVQWRQRFDSNYVTNHYTDGTIEGPKYIDISSGDTSGCTPSVNTNCRGSCTDIELVGQNLSQRGYPQMYNSCVTFSQLSEAYGGSDWKFQNARPAPYCLYSMGASWQAAGGTCIGYFANEWMTFKIHVHIGALSGGNWVNSQIDLWIGRQGQATQHAIQWTGSLYNGGTSDQYGKIWLLPYISNKTGAGDTQPTANTWYDELIISTQDIADPGGTASPPAQTNTVMRRRIM